ncbi:MAG: PTS lactose/cellobiose transporter subunit IIA [Anaerorhabdus sp.]|uniref:PTS lactose/cellobiose transporter subunit IIA n=1 Tax=Anaerorhabdus sp. TaxID=1872524 RepID=UPI003A84456E
MEGIELIAFQIISAVGTARSYYIEAIQDAKQGNFEEARRKIEEGSSIFVEGHHAHAELIQKEANGELDTITLLLMHAEDQLMSAEAFKIIAEEFIDVYESRK